MSKRPTLILDPAMNRRHWIALAASAIAGCGGGDSTVAGSPGTGGTGIYALGAIDGFGSVIINSVRFDDSTAEIRLDGAVTLSSELRLGMVAGVKGSRHIDQLTGTADSISIWSVAQGEVTAVAGGCFTVLGMEIESVASTVFGGLMNAAAVKVGAFVKVWGMQAGASARNWRATRVEAASTGDVIATGLLEARYNRYHLSAIELLDVSPGQVLPGELVRVRGTWDTAARAIRVARLDRVDVSPHTGTGVVVEIEGVVTALGSNGRFMLGSLEVDGSGLNASSVRLGARIEVKGVWRGQVLEATRIEAESEESHSTAEIEARIEVFTSVADFVVRGQRCDASAAQIKGGTASDLGVGVRVHLKGRIVGNVVLVSEMEISH